MNDFEQRLCQTPLKSVPPEWRAAILAAAQPVAPAERPVPWWEWLPAQLHALLWPHPKAWAALAAIWLGILALNLSQGDEPPARPEKFTPPSPAVLAEVRQQQRMLAELVGVPPPLEAVPPKRTAPQPRTQLVRVLMV